MWLLEGKLTVLPAGGPVVKEERVVGVQQRAVCIHGLILFTPVVAAQSEVGFLYV